MSSQCLICFSEYPISETIIICSAKHRFCQECATQYLKSLIESFKVSKITCPQEGCKELFDTNLIKKLLDEKSFQEYEMKLLAKMTNKDPHQKFCPTPGCLRPYKPSETSSYVLCKCGTKICNTCSNPFHEGKSCLEALDLEFEAFSKENNIKFCIVCKSVVQRVEGCVHITCPMCDYEWCWICGREFLSNHQAICPNEWMPEPPQCLINEINSTKINWCELARFLYLSPLIIVTFPLCLCFNIEGLLREAQGNRQNKYDSVSGLVLLNVLYLGGLWFSITELMKAESSVLFMIALVLIGVLGCFTGLIVIGFLGNMSEIAQRASTIVKKKKRWSSRKPQEFKYTTNSRPQGVN